MSEQVIVILVGGVFIFLGATGTINRTRKGERLARLMGETPARLLYVGIGVAAIVLSFFR